MAVTIDLTRPVVEPIGAAADPTVTVGGLRKGFDHGLVLDGADLEIRPGEFVALLGASGSGKTTLLRILAGLDADYQGAVSAPDRRAIVFQEHRLLPWKRVADNVALGLDGPDAGRRAAEVLDEVGLTHRARAWPRTLSGGESQRVALARALVRRPELLLLDEPFGALDALTRTKVHSLVLRLWTSHRPAVLLVTHDVDEALTLADRLLVVVDGRIDAGIPITAPRPRRRADPDLDAMRRAVLERLGVPEPC